jgi:hypothetical protein
MEKTFWEYHQFTEEEFQQLWKKCIFVFDTNALLNMYRYSRRTVDSYFKVLDELKERKQLWIPYHVGYEFHENRVNVISEYENSYDSILELLEKTKVDLEKKYKNHPFLDLELIKTEIDAGLLKVREQVESAKEKHPKWMKSDDVLEKLNKLYEGSIGQSYGEKKVEEIYKEGEIRYEKKIPPGFKDSNKPDSTKYGDLILWYQMLDKAKESKTPIVFISGDIKEDWWLVKNGERLMPLPQLKKEIFSSLLKRLRREWQR